MFVWYHVKNGVILLLTRLPPSLCFTPSITAKLLCHFKPLYCRRQRHASTYVLAAVCQESRQAFLTHTTILLINATRSTTDRVGSELRAFYLLTSRDCTIAPPLIFTLALHNSRDRLPGRSLPLLQAGISIAIMENNASSLKLSPLDTTNSKGKTKIAARDSALGEAPIPRVEDSFPSPSTNNAIAAAKAVLDTTELLEKIGSPLPMRQIFSNAQRVSHHWKGVIDDSTTIQKKLWLRSNSSQIMSPAQHLPKLMGCELGLLNGHPVYASSPEVDPLV